MQNNREVYLKEMQVYRRKVLDSQNVSDYLGIALLVGVFAIWLIHASFPHFLPRDWFKGFEIGYSFILLVFLSGNWIKRRKLQRKYENVYRKFIASK